MDLLQEELKKLDRRKIRRENFQKLLKNSPKDLPISTVYDFLKTDDHLLLASVIRFLGSYRKKSIFPSIARFADHPLPEVRGAVCYSIGAICDLRGREILTKRAKDTNQQVVWEAYIALSKIRCKDSLPIFLKGLDEPNTVIQMLCARALGDMPDVRSLQKLHRMVTNPAPSVRRAVIETLGKIKDNSSISHLVNATTDSNPEVKCVALLGLSYFHKTENTYIFAKAANDLSDNVRMVVVQALESIGTEECTLTLIRMLDDRNYMIRSASAKALGKIGSFEQLNEISSAATDPHWRVRQSVATALGNLGYSESISVLLKLLKDKDYRVRNSAASAIWMIDENDSIDQNIAKELLNININMLQTGDLLTRRKGAENFAKQGIKQAVPVLSSAVKESDSEIRRFSAIALGKTRDSKAYGVLQELIKDQEISVRWESVEQLDLFDQNISERQNLRLMRDPSPSVRLRAAMNLSRNPPQKVLSEISKNLADNNPLVRWGCVHVLTQCTTSNVTNLLKVAVNDNDPDIAFSAAVKLSETGNDEGVPVLLNHLKHPNSYIRRETARSLLMVKINQYGKKILSHMDDTDLLVRRYLSACLVYCADSGVFPGALKYLEDPDPIIRANIIRTLGERTDAESHQHFSMALSDPDMNVRIAALEAIAKSDKEGTIDEIRRFVQVSDRETKTAVARTLGNIKPQGTHAILFEMVKREKNPDVIFHSMNALGEFKLESVKKFLMSYLNDSSKLKRKTAFASLRRIGVSSIRLFLYRYSGRQTS